MKKTILLILGCVIGTISFAQVKVQDGPELNNKENERLNRMIEGEEGYFYAYRVRTRGIGTSYFIEKINEATMKIEFATEVPIPTDYTKVKDVKFSDGQVYIFYQSYDKKVEKMNLKYRTISSKGVLSPKEEILLTKKTEEIEFVDFDITTNQNSAKLAIKTTYKASKKDKYKIDFTLFNPKNKKNEWTKTVDIYLMNLEKYKDLEFDSEADDLATTGLLGFILHDNDDIYYAYYLRLKTKNKNEKRYDANVALLKEASTTPIIVPLSLNPEYKLFDVMFKVNTQNNLVIAGFFKDIIERKGRDLVDVGVFNYRINTLSGEIIGQDTKTFDNTLLLALESNQKKSRNMTYKSDYIISNNDDFYFVGEQYNSYVVSNNAGGVYSTSWNYEYMDIIVVKINPKGEFEWVTNTPLRNKVILKYGHVYKQYFAVKTDKGLYFFYNDNPDNTKIRASKKFTPDDLKYQKSIHGSNFIYSKVSFDGKVTTSVAFENKDYCFAPILEPNIDFAPPQDAEIMINSAKNEVIIYTDDRGEGRFSKVKIEE